MMSAGFLLDGEVRLLVSPDRLNSALQFKRKGEEVVTIIIPVSATARDIAFMVERVVQLLGRA